jgi:hypothetical protein
MPLIDVECTVCGCAFEYVRPLSVCVGERPYPTDPCPKCQSPTTQMHHPSGYSTAPAVVAYQMPDGTFRYPGRSDSPLTHTYEKEGGTRLELRGWAQVRAFEGKVNKHEMEKMERRFVREQAYRERGVRLRRSEMNAAMAQMSDGARHYGRYLQQRSDAAPLPRIHEPGFRVEAFSETRSNREESRDDRGRKLRD